MPVKKIIVKSVTESPNETKAAEADDQILHELFPLIVRPMKTFGVWPANPVTWRRKVFVFITILYVQGPMALYAVKKRNDFLEASYAICEMGASFIYYGRLLSLGISADLYLEVIDDLIKAWRTANNSKTLAWNKNQENLKANVYKCSTFMITYYFVAVIKYSVVTVALQIFRVYVLGKHERIDFAYHIDFIINVLDPFDPIRYSMLAIPTFTVTVAFVTVLAFIALFYALIIFYTGILFRIICFNIDELDQKLNKMDPDAVLNELRTITIAHQEAIKTASKLEAATKYSMLLQVMVNSFFICLISFDIFAIQADFTTISNLAGYGIAILAELLLHSYVCDFLTREATQVSNAVWNAKWYTETPKVRRHLMLIMAYGQTTIGVVRAGISYFTLMRQIYAK